MEKPESALNPDAEPFFYPIIEDSTDQKPQTDPNHEKDKGKATLIPKYEESLKDEQKELDLELEYLKSQFPNFSEESIVEVMNVCHDIFEAKTLLKKLEGIETTSSEDFDDDDSHDKASHSPRP